MDLNYKIIKVLTPIALLISSSSIASDEKQTQQVSNSTQTATLKKKTNTTTDSKAKLTTISQQRGIMRIAAPPGEGGGPGGGPGEGGGHRSIIANDLIHLALNVGSSITPETTDLLGEQIDLNTGSLSFYNTDVSIPGNNGLSVKIGRQYTDSSYSYYNRRDFGDWMLDIPHIRTNSIAARKVAGHWGQGKECSGEPENEPMNNVLQSEYYNGEHIHVPGKISEQLLYRGTKKTKSNWQITCINLGQREGFSVRSPSGETYIFSHYVSDFGGSIGSGDYAVNKINMYLYVTKVTDKFGNSVTYNYNSNGLSSIVSSDNRHITINRNHSARFPKLITSISVNGRTWQYEYSGYDIKSLSKVIRPDNKQWQYQLGAFSSSFNLESLCRIPNRQATTGSVTHPNGVKGTFTIEAVVRGKTDVPRVYNAISNTDYTKKCYQSMAIKKKTLTGPGLPQQHWHYQYSEQYGYYTGEHVPNTSRFRITGVMPSSPSSITYSSRLNNLDYKKTTVLTPDGSKTNYYHNRNHKSVLDGTLVATEYFDTNGTRLLKRQINSYIQGDSIGSTPLSYVNLLPVRYRKNLIQKTIELYDGSTVKAYHTKYSDFNSYGVARKTEQYNSFNSNRSHTKQAYYHDTTNWLLNLPTTTHISDNGSHYILVAQQNYHGATSAYKSAPNYSYSFGRWNKRNESYHTSGTNKGLPRLTRLNGTNRWSEVSNYHRGVPRTIRTPQSTSTSSQYAYRVVDNNGWVTQTTDFEANVTNYRYDNLGRLTRIDPVNSHWHDTIITYTDASGGEAPGVEYGMLVKTTKRGNFEQKQYYDGLLRPVLTKTRDITDSSTTSYVKQSYNAYNKVTFTSQSSASSNPSYGTYTTYDGLGRTTKVRNNALGGNGVRYRYYPDSKVAVTDNRNLTTTTTYKAYGSPSQSMPTHIATPANLANVSMQYNKFSKLTSISQGGITEHRVYDGYQNLCKTVRPDVGNTAMSIDAVGNTTWLARGSSVSSSSSSCDNSVYSADKISYSYDNLGALKTVNYGDSTPTKTYSYDRVGNLKTLSFNGAVHRYEYDDRNNLIEELLSVDGYHWDIEHRYDRNQNLSGQTYPSGTNVYFSPNALGQAKQVSGYLSNVTYHPNGQLKSMSQGSHCSVTQSLKTYGVPDIQRTVCKGQNAVYNQYHYDGNLNVTFWDDKQSNSYDLRFTYDGLDRLDVIKNGSYTTIGNMDYDAMGNITKFKFGSNQVNYSYDSSKKLASTWGAVNYSMSYDDRGNVLGNGQKSFTYNLANQMTQGHGNSYRYDGHDRRVKAVDSKGTRYSFYTSSGKLIFERINGTNRENYYLGSQLVAYKNGSTVTHIHSDLMGSTAATSNSAGAVLTRSRYKPFGNEWGSAKNEMGYTGHKFDTDLGLSYMQARYYDPVIGRFYSNDPIGFTGGIDTFNRYSYVANNPYKYTDPTGMFKDCSSDPNCFFAKGGPSDRNSNTDQAIKKIKKFSDYTQNVADDAINKVDDVVSQLDIDLDKAREIARQELAKRPVAHNNIGDAKRHAIWSKRMSEEISPLTSIIAGYGHEIEGSILQGNFSEALMDLHNNAVGRSSAGGKIDFKKLIASPENAIKKY